MGTQLNAFLHGGTRSFGSGAVGTSIFSARPRVAPVGPVSTGGFELWEPVIVFPAQLGIQGPLPRRGDHIDVVAT